MLLMRISGYFWFFVSATLAGTCYMQGIDPVTVVLTVGSGIALAWLRGTEGNASRSCRLLVGWLFILILGMVVAGLEGDSLLGLALFVAGFASMMASAFTWTYPAWKEAEASGRERKRRVVNPARDERHLDGVDRRSTIGTMRPDVVVLPEHGHAVVLASTDGDEASAQERVEFVELHVLLVVGDDPITTANVAARMNMQEELRSMGSDAGSRTYFVVAPR